MFSICKYPLFHLYFIYDKPLQYAPEKVRKILVGNKSDEVDKRQVATEQGIKVGQSSALCCNYFTVDYES